MRRSRPSGSPPLHVVHRPTTRVAHLRADHECSLRIGATQTVHHQRVEFRRARQHQTRLRSARDPHLHLARGHVPETVGERHRNAQRIARLARDRTHSQVTSADVAPAPASPPEERPAPRPGTDPSPAAPSPPAQASAGRVRHTRPNHERIRQVVARRRVERHRLRLHLAAVFRRACRARTRPPARSTTIRSPRPPAPCTWKTSVSLPPKSRRPRHHLHVTTRVSPLPCRPEPSSSPGRTA